MWNNYAKVSFPFFFILFPLKNDLQKSVLFCKSIIIVPNLVYISSGKFAIIIFRLFRHIILRFSNCSIVTKKYTFSSKATFYFEFQTICGETIL